MYAVRCPNCGKPGPVALAQPDHFACDTCEFAGPIDLELTETLCRVDSLVSTHDVRERQMSRFQQRLV